MADQASNPKRERFAALLRELFQLNQPDLDFGIYRIMHARKDDINRFIEKDLPRIVNEAFKDFAGQDKVALQAELEKAIKAAEAAEVDPDESPRVQKIKAQLNEAVNLGREEGEVYDALITFFNRYYDEGDFISRRVYKDGTYAIPYNGEEVVLHWANKDQYYIKSSETLRDYSFRLDPDNEQNPMRVHFRLVDAEAGAQNNNKESDESKRVFVLDSEQPWEEVPSSDPAEQGTELNLRFHYRAATPADWIASVKKSATAAAAKKPPTQDHLRQIAVERLLGADSDLPQVWKQRLASPYTKANGEKADYSILQGQLDKYTKKNTFDYFIHKDLGGFLTRELDFYIKNELLRWEDVAALKNHPARLAPLLSKIEVIRTIGEKIIAFLAQLEEFQKKLWLKKKFVTEVNYCITLDRLEGHEELLEEIFANEAQRQQWKTLYALDLKKLDNDYEKLSWGEFLGKEKYRYLMLDTGYFKGDLKVRLLAGIDALDDQCEGILICSENFQALNLLNSRYCSQIKCSYVDPPYNTGQDDFVYKDNYQHSSWLSLLTDRIVNASSLLSDDGVLLVSCDDGEEHRLRLSMDESLGSVRFMSNLVWKSRQNVDSRSKNNISNDHEFVLAYGKSLRGSEKDLDKYSNPDKDPRGAWMSDNMVGLATRQARPNLHYDLVVVPPDAFNVRGGEIQIAFEGYKYVGSSECWFGKVFEEGENVFACVALPDGSPHTRLRRILAAGVVPKPLDGRTVFTSVYVCPDKGWRYDPRSMARKVIENRIIWPTSPDGRPRKKTYKEELLSDFTGFSSVVGYTRDGTSELVSLFGPDPGVSFPKPVTLIATLLKQASNESDVILDYFAGSGTTAHAVIALNRNEGSRRKYVLVEMGGHFDTVLKRRVQKAIYAKEWENGKPESTSSGINAGVSHCFKYLRLESYEDAVGNLALSRGPAQQLLLDSQNEQDGFAREAYLLHYMLDIETRGSESLLNVKNFLDPANYKLKVRNPTGDETKWVNVDLLETFNWLLGLTVEYIAAPIHFDAELKQAEYGRWQAAAKRRDEGRWWFRTVTGINRKGQKILVVWRNLPSVIAGEELGLVKDNAVLDAVLIDKLKLRLTESVDDEFDVLYVNGDHNISIPKKRNGELLEARIKLIEEDFHRLMFSTETP